MNVYSIIDKYYQKGSQLYHILVTHSELVTHKALSIIDANPQIAVDRKFIEEAAMLHDIGIFMTNAPRISCVGEYPYIAHGYLGAELLRKEGFPRHALVCERHTGCGLSLDQIERENLPLPHRDMCPVSIEEQIICFADKFYSKTHLNTELPLQKIRQKMEKIGPDVLAKFDEWCVLFHVEE